jgi:hypothetical protein
VQCCWCAAQRRRTAATARSAVRDPPPSPTHPHRPGQPPLIIRTNFIYSTHMCIFSAQCNVLISCFCVRPAQLSFLGTAMHMYATSSSPAVFLFNALRQPSKRQCPCVGVLHRDRTASTLACVQYGRLVMVCDVRAGSCSRQQGALRRGRGRPRACGRCRGMAWGKPQSTLAPSSPAPTPASACESSPSATPLPPDQRSSV